MESISGAAEPIFLDSLHEAFERLFSGSTVAETPKLLFMTATAEIAANILEHAATRGTGCQVSLRLELGPDRVEGWFEDDGRPLAKRMEIQGMGAELPERGRGLEIAMAALDQLTYDRHEGRNRWHLVKLIA